jgi:hypothetical protein
MANQAQQAHIVLPDGLMPHTAAGSTSAPLPLIDH